MIDLEFVEGCKLGLGDYPLTLPDEICCQPCDWKIKSSKYFNCLWALTSDPDQEGMSLRRIASMLGMTHESVRQILKSAMYKLPTDDFQLDQLLNDVEEEVVQKKTGIVDKEMILNLLDLLED